jgi:hypothetical protein
LNKIYISFLWSGKVLYLSVNFISGRGEKTCIEGCQSRGYTKTIEFMNSNGTIKLTLKENKCHGKQRQ